MKNKQKLIESNIFKINVPIPSQFENIFEELITEINVLEQKINDLNKEINNLKNK